jgi:hypothetical protein
LTHSLVGLIDPLVRFIDPLVDFIDMPALINQMLSHIVKPLVGQPENRLYLSILRLDAVELRYDQFLNDLFDYFCGFHQFFRRRVRKDALPGVND